VRALGILEDVATRTRTTLGPRCLIGRRTGCDLCPTDLRISGEHAVVRWLDERWEVRDLGSRNGTFVDGRRLSPGERAALGAGAVIALGGPKTAFALVDASPPMVGARQKKTGAGRFAADHVLVLPDEDRPLVTIFEDAMGRWVAEREDRTEVVKDHDVVLIDGDAWVLELPAGVRAAPEASTGPTLETIAMRIEVSSGDEDVDVTLLHGGETTLLARWSSHYLLLALARARLADAAGGWVSRDELCNTLSVDAPRLDVDVCRARKQVGAAGVLGAAGIVERRAAGQLRLGVRTVEVAAMGAGSAA
jgi:hypothetical protein